MASFSDKPERVSKALEGGCDPNYSGASHHQEQDYDGEDDPDEFVHNFSILHIIATEGSDMALEVLIDLPGLEINPLTSRNTTPVWEATFWGQTDIVKALAAKGGDVNMPDHEVNV